MRLRDRLAAGFLLLGAGCGEEEEPRREDYCRTDPSPPQVGDACYAGATWCGGTQELLECKDGVFVRVEPPVACSNRICAVPGFVGLDRAGRARVAARRLRA